MQLIKTIPPQKSQTTFSVIRQNLAPKSPYAFSSTDILVLMFVIQELKSIQKKI